MERDRSQQVNLDFPGVKQPDMKTFGKTRAEKLVKDIKKNRKENPEVGMTNRVEIMVTNVLDYGEEDRGNSTRATQKQSNQNR